MVSVLSQISDLQNDYCKKILISSVSKNLKHLSLRFLRQFLIFEIPMSIYGMNPLLLDMLVALLSIKNLSDQYHEHHILQDIVNLWMMVGPPRLLSELSKSSTVIFLTEVLELMEEKCSDINSHFMRQWSLISNPVRQMDLKLLSLVISIFVIARSISLDQKKMSIV